MVSHKVSLGKNKIEIKNKLPWCWIIANNLQFEGIQLNISQLSGMARRVSAFISQLHDME